MALPRSLGIFAIFSALLPIRAGAFTLSHAPVVNDPTATHRRTALLWPHISLREARRLLGKKGVVFIDGRSRSEWKQSRIPGAISMPGMEFQNYFPVIRSKLIHAKVIVLYCHGYSCGAGDYIAQLLADQGLRNMAVYSGGFPEWKAAHEPLEVPGRRKKGHKNSG